MIEENRLLEKIKHRFVTTVNVGLLCDIYNVYRNVCKRSTHMGHDTTPDSTQHFQTHICFDH